MKSLTLTLGVLIILTSTTLIADVPDTNNALWLRNTAYTLPENRFEIGLFHKANYGFSDNLQFSCNPILFFIMPNLDLKWNHDKLFGLEFASYHSVYYPTFIMKMISKKGILGLIDPEFDIPQMISIANEVLLTKNIGAEHYITAKLGLNFAIVGDNLDKSTSIDLPYIYPRMSVFHNGFIINAALNYQTFISDEFNFYFEN
jgi:hypothetical protein